MSRLDDASFKGTFEDRMERIVSWTEPPFDFWPYFESIPNEDFEHHDCSEGIVDWVWRSEDGRFEHILVNTREDEDAFMVIVLDREANSVFGHHFINLKNEYGIDS
jgi:hypothetical protein